MAVMDGDLLKKENIGIKVLDFQFNTRRSGTLTRKHASPAFQPPLPPSEGGPPAEPLANASDANTANSVPVQPVAFTDSAPTYGQEESSSNKTKETPTATTPPSLRNGAHTPSSGNTNQFAVVPAPQGTANPSPHSNRRATKKPAPAPPKPANPPPVQPVNQNLPAAANTPPSVSPKPSNHNPPSTTSNQGGTVAASAYGTLPRRHSGSQPIIQAPNHPPPQPPTQPSPQPKPTGAAPTVPATEQSSSPSHSPTPPDTPPPLSDHPSSQTALPEATLTSGPHNTGTLTRQRPVPKPRVRPTVPPPPQPPASQPSVEPGSASKFITDPVQGHPIAESVCTVPIVDPQSLPVVLLDTEVESTAL